MKKTVLFTSLLLLTGLTITGCSGIPKHRTAEESIEAEIPDTGTEITTETEEESETETETETESEKSDYQRGMEITNINDLHNLTSFDTADVTFSLDFDYPDDKNAELIMQKKSDSSYFKIELEKDSDYTDTVDLPYGDYKVVDIYLDGVSAYDFEGSGDNISIDKSSDDKTYTFSGKCTLAAYPASEVWANITTDTYAVQIDDIIYETGISGDEVISRMNNSASDYTITNDVGNKLTGNALVGPGETYPVYAYRGGIYWFQAEITNDTDDTMMLNDCKVVDYELSDIARDYTYYMGGLSYKTLLGYTFTDITTLQNRFLDVCPALENGKRYSEEEKSDGSQTYFLISYTYTRDDGSGMYYLFSLEKESGKVVQFDLEAITGE